VISEKEALCNQVSYLRQGLLYTIFPSINTLKLNEPSTGFPLHVFVCKDGSYREWGYPAQLAICFLAPCKMPYRCTKQQNRPVYVEFPSSGPKEMLVLTGWATKLFLEVMDEQKGSFCC